jgi:FK506-binding nuclear protein
MKVGGIRRLDIPAALAYADNPPPGIPPDARLVFEVKLAGVG